MTTNELSSFDSNATMPNYRESFVIVKRSKFPQVLAWLVFALVLGSLSYTFVRGELDFGTVAAYLFSNAILEGAASTIFITVLSMFVGIALGLLAAIATISRNYVARTLAAIYIWLFRGTPLLIQILLWYNLSLVFPTVSLIGIGSVDTNTLMTPFLTALLALGINEGAYMAEILRGGFLGVPEGQITAAKALGMRPSLWRAYILIPQTTRICAPNIANEFIIMLKASSLVSIVQYTELLFSAQTIYYQNFQVIALLLVASFWYLVMTSTFTILETRFERFLNRSI